MTARSDIADFFARSNTAPSEGASSDAAAGGTPDATPDAATATLLAYPAASASALERPALCTDDEYDDAALFVDTMTIPAMPTSSSFDVELCATSIYALVLEDAQNANTSALALKVNTVGRTQFSRSRGDVFRPNNSVGQQLSLNLLVDSAECVASPGLQLRASNVQLLAPARGTLEVSARRIPGCIGAATAMFALQSAELHLSYATWMIVQQVLRGWNALPSTGAGAGGEGTGACSADEVAEEEEGVGVFALPADLRRFSVRPRANALRASRRVSLRNFMAGSR